MTTRADIPRLGGSLGVLGLLLEEKGQNAWDVIAGWQLGPQKAPGVAGDDVCGCGHSIESHAGPTDICLHATGDDAGTHYCPCVCFAPTPNGSEAGAAERKQHQRAAEHFAEHKADLNELDRLVQRIIRRMDVACPPNPAEVKNRRTGNLDPITPAEAAVDGWCASCWRDDQHKTEIDVHKTTSLRYYRDYCRWCGTFKGTYGMEPPMEILKQHHIPGRRINPDEMEAAVAKILEQQASKQSKGKKKKRKKGWVAA